MSLTIETGLMYAGMLLYIVAALMAIRYFSTGAASSGVGRALVFGAVACHIGALVVRGSRDGSFPAQNLRDFGVLTLTLMAAVALVLDVVKRMPSLLYGVVPVAAVGIPLAGVIQRTSGETGTAPEASVWTGLHIIATTAGYACFLIAFVSGLIYVAAQRELREKGDRAMSMRLPSLESALRVNFICVLLGFALLTAGILLGYLYARGVESGSDWRLDPKVIFTTFTWLCYGAVLALALRPRWRGRRAVIASMVSFVSVILTLWASLAWTQFHKFP